MLGSEGTPVIKLAGLAGGVGLFEEEMEAARRGGFRIVALDTTGDRADDPAHAPLTWESLSADVVAALDALALPRGILWGTSFGCLVALAAAARRPERVSGLLLCHPPDPLRRPFYQTRLVRWVDGREDPARALSRVFRILFRLLSSWEGIYPTTITRIPALLRASAEAATPARTLLDKARLLSYEPPGLPPGEFPIPVSIVAGRWDTIAPPAEARRLAARLPAARLVFIPFSGHAGAYSRPRAYARIVLEELTRLESGRVGD